jgi:hypothetical protein
MMGALMRQFLFAAVLIAACHGSDPAKGAATPANAATTTTPSTAAAAPAPATPAPAPATPAPAPATPAPPTQVADNGSAGSAASPAPADDPPAAMPVADGGHDFTPEARALLAVGACGKAPAPAGFPDKLLTAHCAIIEEAQKAYVDKWVTPARAFFADHVPANVPKHVVYPFAGGDLSTALTVFPDADEITTISLEPAGDPRDIDTLAGHDLERALKTVEDQLKFLYRVNFSNTKDMIDAMRGGQLPTQLIFGLSALKVHGYELVKLRYFRLEKDGSIHYIDDNDLKKAPDSKRAQASTRNRVFANAEVLFRKPGGRIQVYRHMQWNLDDAHLKKMPQILKYLEAQGQVAGMTKAASYLLSFDDFKTMRSYLIGHVVWMVSDATGIAPKWGKPAGFTYETWGTYEGSHMNAGISIAPDWRKEFASEPHRDLPFRFGYYDKHNANNLIIIHK